MYIDSHCHLTDDKYENVTALIDDSLRLLCTVGYDLESSVRGAELAKTHDKVYALVGIHPHDAKTYSTEVEKKLISLCQQKKVVGIGEIGLDYYYDHSPRHTQREVFISQLLLAKKLRKPVALHVRDAYGEAFEILTEYKSCLCYGGILHCYSGSAEMLERFLELGLYVSFSGAITFKNNQKASYCILKVPRDKILTETDSPYLTPMPFRGQLNYPKYVSYVAEKIADTYGMSVEKLNEQVYLNMKELFKL